MYRSILILVLLVASACQIVYKDADGDGRGHPHKRSSVLLGTDHPGWVKVTGDCDDFDKSIYSGAEEICDLEDNDCDGLIDEGLVSIYYRDFDGDTYGDKFHQLMSCFSEKELGYKYSLKAGDCYDNDHKSHPGADEVCDKIDNDCDGETDEGCSTEPS
jgi:hypothetical protein